MTGAAAGREEGGRKPEKKGQIGVCGRIAGKLIVIGLPSKRKILIMNYLQFHFLEGGMLGLILKS
jgi:hypothetical protein